MIVNPSSTKSSKKPFYLELSSFCSSNPSAGFFDFIGFAEQCLKAEHENQSTDPNSEFIINFLLLMFTEKSDSYEFISPTYLYRHPTWSPKLNGAPVTFSDFLKDANVTFLDQLLSDSSVSSPIILSRAWDLKYIHSGNPKDGQNALKYFLDLPILNMAELDQKIEFHNDHWLRAYKIATELKNQLVIEQIKANLSCSN